MLGLQVQGKVTGIQKFLSNVNETNARQTDWARLLFYGLPIELQYVPGEDLLGSITSTQQRTISMQQPANETVLIVLYVQQDPDQRLFQDSMPELSASEDTPGQFDWYGHRWRT